jgi:hypothetical protein
MYVMLRPLRLLNKRKKDWMTYFSVHLVIQRPVHKSKGLKYVSDLVGIDTAILHMTNM